MGLLIWIDRKKVLRPGNLFVLYVGGYGLGRLWVESLRSDAASQLLGLRVNVWMSLALIAGAAVVLAVRGVRRRPDEIDEPYRVPPPGFGAETDEPRPTPRPTLRSTTRSAELERQVSCGDGRERRRTRQRDAEVGCVPGGLTGERGGGGCVRAPCPRAACADATRAGHESSP